MENQKADTPKAQRREMTQRFLQALKNILDKNFKGFPQADELAEFMQDESRLYDKEGKITPEYQEWISRFENYSKNHPITPEQSTLSDHQKGILDGAMEYLSLRQDSMEAYEKENSLDEWLEKELPDEAQKEMFKKIIKEELEETIKDLDKNGK